MYKTFYNLDWKILVAICFTAFGFIALFIYFSINSASPTKSTPSISPPTQQTATPTPAWQVYAGEGYSISYPPDVTITPSTISGGGNTLVFHQSQDPDFNLVLEVIPSIKTNNAEIIYGIFRTFLYPETDINISGAPGKQFSGSSKFEEETLQEIAAILENKGKIYKLHLLYSSEQRNAKADDLFSQILSTLRFN
mgnify:CR=1 FL=1